jgi:G3E family GTPase
VDAKHVELHLDEQKPEGVVNEALEQIAYADRVILNKTDLVEPSDLERLEDRIRAINSMADVRRAQKADVPVDYVLGVGGFELEKVEDQVMAKDTHHHHHDHEHSHDHEHECAGADCTHESHAHSHSHDHAHGHAHGGSEHECAGAGCTHESHSHSHAHGHSHAHHDDAVGSVSVTIEGDMDLDKVRRSWLGSWRGRQRASLRVGGAGSLFLLFVSVGLAACLGLCRWGRQLASLVGLVYWLPRPCAAVPAGQLLAGRADRGEEQRPVPHEGRAGHQGL